MKVAIVGTGAGGFGTALGLVASGRDLTIDFFDSGPDAPPPSFAGEPPQTWSRSQMLQAMHRNSARGRSLMPPRTHFGELPQRYEGPHSPRLYKSDNQGGLTRFWSASVFQFLPEDFAGWPISESALIPYYRAVAKAIGIAGDRGRLDEIFGGQYVNQPPIPMLPSQHVLTEKLNAKGNTQYVAGANRLAIATAADDERRCVACGECFSGCFRGAIFDAGLGIRNLFQERQPALIRKRVERFETVNGQPVITAGGERYSGYDKVFLATGCISSTEIILKSLGLRNTPVHLHDNPMILFPILRFGMPTFSENRKYVSIANQIIGFPASNDEGHYAQVHVNPVPNLLLRHLTPAALWPVVEPLGDGLRSMAFIAKLYLHSSYGKHHRLSIDDDDVFRIQEDTSQPGRGEEQRMKRKIRDALRGTGFATTHFPWIRTASSVHYAGTLPYGNQLVPIGRTGEVIPNVHLCDSTVFPQSPAQPLTFTIMANAMRTACEVMDG